MLSAEEEIVFGRRSLYITSWPSPEPLGRQLEEKGHQSTTGVDNPTQ